MPALGRTCIRLCKCVSELVLVSLSVWLPFQICTRWVIEREREREEAIERKRQWHSKGDRERERHSKGEIV